MSPPKLPPKHLTAPPKSLHNPLKALKAKWPSKRPSSAQPEGANTPKDLSITRTIITLPAHPQVLPAHREVGALILTLPAGGGVFGTVPYLCVSAGEL